jgi:5-dehydro-2-deoxygluconokinase
MAREFDVLCIGRSSIDLYANETGVPFTEIKSFAAYVGGCPANVSVATQRLGLRTALLTAVGEDHVGDFVMSFLEKEGVNTQFARRKPGRRTSAFLLGIEPPDKFSLVPYRDNCADLEITIDDVQPAPISECGAVFITGSGLSRQPSREATFFAAAQTRAPETKLILDLDFRSELWPDEGAFGFSISSILPLVDIVVGTADEFERVMPKDFSRKADNDDRFAEIVTAILSAGPETLVIKRGAESTIVYSQSGEKLAVPTFPVDVCNVLGAGDAFAGGFLYGYLKGWDLYRAARMGNACGAIVVTRHGCANFMPYEREVLAFINDRGGF